MLGLAHLLGSKTITQGDFASLRAMTPKRQICGASMLKMANGKGPAMAFLSTKFGESFDALLPWTLKRKTSRYGEFFSHTVKSQTRYDAIQSWLTTHEGVVFIRSLMESTIALSLHQSEPGIRTEVGDLEYRAKSKEDPSAVEEIAKRMAEKIALLHLPQSANAICSVPPSIAGNLSLPNRIAERIGAILKLPDLTAELEWAGEKPSIKSTGVEEKWQVLEAVGLDVGEGFAGKQVILIDDLYQSGTTAHFVASKLYAAKVSRVHCFAVVKGLSDKDNS